MQNILRTHALKTMWAETVQDNQYIIRPNRLTRDFGATKYTSLHWETVELPNYPDPTNRASYHLYSLGQLPSWLLTLCIPNRKWRRLDQLCAESNTVVDVWTDNGMIIPRSLCYIAQDYVGTLILAIDRKQLDYGKYKIKTPYDEIIDSPYNLDNIKHGITVRFYCNAYIQTPEFRDTVPLPATTLTDYCLTINNSADLTKYKAEVARIEKLYRVGTKLHGKGIHYSDGWMISEPKGYSPVTYPPGTILSYRFDETIREILQFKMRTAPGFTSIKDVRKKKYFFMNPSDTGKIDFFDDLDFYLCVPASGGGYKGAILSKLSASTIRQVTHDCWSIAEDEVIRISQQHQLLANVIGLEIVVVVRNGGMMHNLAFETSRIEDLYHLTYDERINVMSGANAGLDIWLAQNLENSAYIELMSSRARQITQDLVERAYGYNAAVKAVQNSVTKPNPDTGMTPISVGFTIPQTSFIPGAKPKGVTLNQWIYDTEGKLIEYRDITTTSSYVRTPTYDNKTVGYIETFLGRIGSLGMHDGGFLDTRVVQDTHYGYYGHRNYVCNVDPVTGIMDGNWIDVTNDDYATYTPSKDGKPPFITWNTAILDRNNQRGVTRIADRVNVRARTFRKNNTTKGVMRFTLMSTTDTDIIPSPGLFGHVDVFINGDAMIEGLDYFITKSSDIVIIKHISTTSAEIIVRYYGYGRTEEPTSFKPRDIGFIKNGRLSQNGVYNTIHDRAPRVVVGGRIFTIDEVNMAEDNSKGLEKYDGYPYSIEDYQPLVEPYTNQATVDYQEESYKLDKEVSDFLTPRLPEPDVIHNYVTPTRWLVYSPVMATFIAMMVNRELRDSEIESLKDQKKLMEFINQIVEPYRFIDPSIIGTDLNYVKILPVPFEEVFELTLLQFTTLEYINETICNNLIDLSQFIKII